MHSGFIWWLISILYELFAVDSHLDSRSFGLWHEEINWKWDFRNVFLLETPLMMNLQSFKWFLLFYPNRIASLLMHHHPSKNSLCLLALNISVAAFRFWWQTWIQSEFQRKMNDLKKYKVVALDHFILRE